MRRLSILFSFFVFTLILFGCETSSNNYEKLIQDGIFEFQNEVVESINLPTTKTIDGVTFDVSWTSSHPNIIAHDGTFLGNPSTDTTITLSALVKKDGFEKTLTYQVLVKATLIHTVTFDANGGESIDPITVTHGQLVTEPTPPTRENYVFDGWYIDLTLFDFDTPITEDIELVAKWSVLPYFQVTFTNLDDTIIKTVLVPSGSKVETVLPNDILGYTFLGWVKPDLTVFDIETEPIITDLVLIPIYDIIDYDIIYQIDGSTTLSEIGSDTYTILGESNLKTASLDGYVFLSWYKDLQLTEPVTEIEAGLTGDITLYPKFEQNLDGMLIYTKEDLVNLIENGATSNVYLMNDIDLSGVTLVGSGHTFGYTFDGRGHTIRQADILGTSNKRGLLFKEVLSTGVVKNVTFADSIHRGGGSSESSAFITAFAQAGARFEHINFYNVSVIHTGSYAALLFGDVITAGGSDPIVVKGITVINNESAYVEGSSYVGGLIGSARVAVRIDVSDIYFDSKVSATNQAAGAIMGRFNSSSIELNVSQAVIKGQVSSLKNVGAVLGTSVSGSTLNINDIFISNMTLSAGNSTINLGAGNKPSGSVTNQSNLYYSSETVSAFAADNSHNLTDGSALSLASITETWFESSQLNPNFFAYHNSDIVRKATGDEVIETGFSIQTSDVNKYYMLGDALNLTGLKVFKVFSDGSSIELNPSDYEVDTTTFDSSQTGSYEIKVNYNGDIKTFTVDVVEIIGLHVDTIDYKQTYIVGDYFNNFIGLYVEAILNDGNTIRLKDSDFTLDVTNLNMNTVGTHSMFVKYKTFESEPIIIHVHDTNYTISSVINLEVDQNFTGIDGHINGAFVQFKTIKSALQFLENLDLDDTIEKRIFVKNGIYREKITIRTPNLYLIGESQDNTIITYDAASGLIRPNGASFGTQGSATVSVKSSAYLFRAAHLTIMNDFDYNGSTLSDKQGVALVNEADRALYVNVSFKGYQDTLYAKSGRQLYYNVYIEGVVDFIFGNGGPAFFTESIIKSLSRSTGVISTNKGYNTSDTALVDYGYVFYNNSFIYEAGVPASSVDLGRPWGKDAAIAYIENTFDQHISSRGWTDMSGNLPEDANFFEYGNKDAFGNVLPTTTKGVTLTQQQRDLFIDTEVVFGLTNGDITFTEIFDYDADLIALLEYHTN